MQIITDRPQAPTAIRADLGAIFVSLELSRSTWLITSLSPGGGEKMSTHTVRSGDVAGLRARFSQLKDKVQVRTGQVVPIILIQEAGLDGFWIHRLLQNEAVESHVVDPASIATSRRRRWAKTDKIDGETLVRALLAYKRGEPRVCAMVRAPTPQEEDRRRIYRERKTLTACFGVDCAPIQGPYFGPIDRQRNGSSTSIGSRGCSSPRAFLTIQLAWLWVRHQPRSILSLWFHQRVQLNGGLVQKC